MLDALASFRVEEGVCDAVGEVVIDDHNDAVPLHCLGSVLLRGGVRPCVALRAVCQLAQVRCPPLHTAICPAALEPVCHLPRVNCRVQHIQVVVCTALHLGFPVPPQPTSLPPGTLLGLTLIDALSARGVGDVVMDAVATTLLHPSGSTSYAPPVDHDPCTVHEGMVVKVLRSAGVTPITISAIKKKLSGQGQAATVGAVMSGHVVCWRVACIVLCGACMRRVGRVCCLCGMLDVWWS